MSVACWCCCGYLKKCSAYFMSFLSLHSYDRTHPPTQDGVGRSCIHGREFRNDGIPPLAFPTKRQCLIFEKRYRERYSLAWNPSLEIWAACKVPLVGSFQPFCLCSVGGGGWYCSGGNLRVLPSRGSFTIGCRLFPGGRCHVESWQMQMDRDGSTGL
jgi:hypothetical protein